MGIENMRRWPMYIVFSVCILLTLSLFNSYSVQTELENRIRQLGTQVQDCSKLQRTCMEDSLSLLEQKERFSVKISGLESVKSKLNDEVNDYKDKVQKSEDQVNRTLMDVQLCKTELESLKNLQLHKSATLDALRLEKETLTGQLVEKKQKIEELEAEILKLKASITTKSAPNAQAPSKVTPAAAPPKQSPEFEAQNAINEPVLENVENDAKEDLDDINAVNDANNDFDPQLQ